MTGAAAAEARRRLRLPALRRVQAHDGVRQRRLRARRSASGRRRRSRRASTSCSSSCSSRASPSATRRSSRADSASGWRSPARSRSSPKVLLLDEPFGALDARVRAELREWLRRLHDETHTTTVIVTHDQEEAMEVADQVAVMNNGRIEQVGRSARALRAPGERVRDGLRRPGEPRRRDVRPAARPRAALRAERHDARGDGRAASSTSASRCASSSSATTASSCGRRSRATAAEQLGLEAGQIVYVQADARDDVH